MLDNKNLIYYHEETPIISQPLQESINKISTGNENLIDNEIKNDDNYAGNNGRWGKSEHIRFLGGCLLYGNNWKKVETYVRTRTSTQIRSHAQKYLKKLEKKYYSKGLSPNQNASPNESFMEEISNKNNLSKNKENKNNFEDKKQENINNKENNTDKNNADNNNTQLFSFNNEEFITVDNKTKLSDEKIKQLIEELPKPDFNLEIVEKIILRIFRLNKKFEDFPKPDTNSKKNGNKANLGNNRNNKNIFLCQKLKREINYEAQIKDLLNSNNQSDLNKLFKIFEEGKDSIWYDILMKQINDN
jgi:SHAQKYF class myb-like DNA-binding protein